MTLRKKTLFFTSVALFIIAISSLLLWWTILLKSFIHLENQNIQLNLQRATHALSENLQNLEIFASDWAAWDDTYIFVEDLNETYIESNLVNETFTGADLNLILFINSQGEIVWGKAFDLENEEEISVPQSLQKHISSQGLFKTESATTGILLLPENPLLVTSQPILTSKEEGPARGVLIMGQYLDSTKIKSLAEITHLSLSVSRIDALQMSADLKAAVLSLSKKKPTEEPILTSPLDNQTIAGYSFVTDIYHEPALILKVETPREIYQQGRATAFYLLILLMIVGVTIGVINILIIEKTVLFRLEKLGAEVSQIEKSGQASERVVVSGNDELSSLAEKINRMLGKIQQFQEQHKKTEVELKKRNEELEKMNQIMVGRELKMAEMKEEIKELKKKLNRET